MATNGPGERAVQLPWFWPSAGTLHSLVQTPTPGLIELYRSDPGYVQFALTHNVPLAELAVRESHLGQWSEMLASRNVPWVDWNEPAVQPVARTAYACACFAQILGESLEVATTARAIVGGWLAYAGWLAVAVVEPEAIVNVLDGLGGPTARQKQAWGMSRAEIAWHLSTKWTLPRFAQVILGRLDALPADAGLMGGDRRIQAIVQVAVALAEQAETRLGVAGEFDLAGALAELQLRTVDLDHIRARFSRTMNVDRWIGQDWIDPRTMSHFANRLVADVNPEYADDVSETVLVDLTDERIHAAKMAAIAEFAAGAGHEINNPLAVISGQSEFLLKHETDTDRRKSLQSIMRQTERVHALLTELMYFARPPALKREWIEIGTFVRDAVDAVRPLAGHRSVKIELQGTNSTVWVNGDPKHLRIALNALIRNGIEAAPFGGWVRVMLSFPDGGVEIAVDDSGPGPDERSREHLFDPFYSGRTAGRGRGLGLPAAWRLAREHGGSVRFVPLADGPTRFVLTLPASVVMAAVQRKTA